MAWRRPEPPKRASALRPHFRLGPGSAASAATGAFVRVALRLGPRWMKWPTQSSVGCAKEAER